MTNEEGYAAVKSFIRAIATVIVHREGAEPSEQTTAFFLERMERLMSANPDYLTPDQTKLASNLFEVLKDAIDQAIENREILKNPQ